MAETKMRDSDYDLLHDIAVEGRVVWEDKRERVPRAALKRLSELGFVRVSTNTISQWTFGPPSPHFGDPDYRRLRADWHNWHRMHPSSWGDNRVEVRADITNWGEEFLRSQK